MNKKIYVLSGVVIVFALAGCAGNQTKIGEGTALGGILGAATGAIIGHQSGEGAKGALLGGLVGSAGGAAVGAQMPKYDKPYENQGSAASSIRAVTMQQVVDWTGEGLSADEIISRIRATNTTYSLTAEDVSYLQRLGVSQRVIDVMNNG